MSRFFGFNIVNWFKRKLKKVKRFMYIIVIDLRRNNELDRIT